MTVSPLLAILGFLTCRAAAVGTGDVFFLLGLGLHFVLIGVALGHSFEHQTTAGYYIIYIRHISDGKV